MLDVQMTRMQKFLHPLFSFDTLPKAGLEEIQPRFQLREPEYLSDTS